MLTNTALNKISESFILKKYDLHISLVVFSLFALCIFAGGLLLH